MYDRAHGSVNGSILDENIYLTKILLFTNDAYQIAEELTKHSETTVNTNCINTIGMYPIISRIKTHIGILCMSIWIISDNRRFEQFRMAYYSGASHSIILKKATDDNEKVAGLFVITPQGVPTTILTVCENEIETNRLTDIFSYPDSRAIHYKSISNVSLISDVFNEIGQRISDEIISGEYQTFTPQLDNPSKIFKLYNKKSFDKVQNLVSKLGYELQDNGIVTLSKDIFTFDIDFYQNQVKAKITNCITCDKQCKHYQKLCVIEEDQGFSNFVHFDNLRALAILYSIHDGSFTTLAGERPKENIKYQLKKLKSLYEVNCPYYEEEKEFKKNLTTPRRKDKRETISS